MLRLSPLNAMTSYDDIFKRVLLTVHVLDLQPGITSQKNGVSEPLSFRCINLLWIPVQAQCRHCQGLIHKDGPLLPLIPASRFPNLAQRPCQCTSAATQVHHTPCCRGVKMGLKHLVSCENWFLCSFVCQFIHLYHVLSSIHPSNSWCQIWLKCCQRWVTNQMFKSSLSTASSTPTRSVKSNAFRTVLKMTGQMIVWGQELENYIYYNMLHNKDIIILNHWRPPANKPRKPENTSGQVEACHNRAACPVHGHVPSFWRISFRNSPVLHPAASKQPRTCLTGYGDMGLLMSAHRCMSHGVTAICFNRGAPLFSSSSETMYLQLLDYDTFSKL